jgi:hypothetical protein
MCNAALVLCKLEIALTDLPAEVPNLVGMKAAATASTAKRAKTLANMILVYGWNSEKNCE